VVQQALVELQVRLEHKVMQVTLVQMEQVGLQVRLVQQEILVLQVTPVIQVQMR